MGTRALTKVFEDGEMILNMYRQMDGYPSGHGLELAEFLNGFTIVNGIGCNQPAKIANGMGCLAAQLVANFKTDVGGFYLMACSEDSTEAYEYLIKGGYNDDNTPMEVTIEVLEYHKSVFTGSVPEFLAYCEAAD